jgi:hypothetical protein
LENTALLADADKEINLKIDSEIKKLTTTIEGMACTIEGLKNTDIALTNNQKDSSLRFHVETKQTTSFWEFNSLISYRSKLTDTHNAMNTGTGTFTAPFSGKYGFVFYSTFYCDNTYRELYLYLNGGKGKIFHCFTSTTYDYRSTSVYFALTLKTGDTVGIYTGTAQVALWPHAAKFTGFLLQKN